MPDGERLLAEGLEPLQCPCLVLCPDNDDEAYAAVEGPEHLRLIHGAALFKEAEYLRRLPRTPLDYRLCSVGQDPRDVVYEAAARDMGHAEYVDLAHEREDRSYVYAGRGQEDR